MSERMESIFLQVDMMYYLMKRWRKSFQEFLELDTSFQILELLRLAYERFHLMGDEGIAEEIEEHIEQCVGVWR